MTDNTVQPKSHYGAAAPVLATLMASVIAALLGVGSGVVMAHVAPGEKFSLAGLAVAPLWLLLEIVFELVVGLFGPYSRFARIAVTASVLIGFYIAWFVVRPL